MLVRIGARGADAGELMTNPRGVRRGVEWRGLRATHGFGGGTKSCQIEAGRCPR